MKALFWIGLVTLILGVVSLIVAIPHNNREGVSIGGLTVGVTTHREEKLAPALSAVMILGGLGAIVAAKATRS